MYRIRYKIRKLFLPPILIGLVIIFTIIIINNNGTLLKSVFYNYQIRFHSMPGSYLATRTPNESYCNFRYGLPDELLYEESDLDLPLEGNSADYRILKNVIEAKWEQGVPEVTYASHVTADFINYIAEIIRSWEGPLSISAFAPDSDADLVLRQVGRLCRCAPEMGRVSLHLVFPQQAAPYLQQHQERPSCELPPAPLTFRAGNSVMYPINVCRNVARGFAPTDWVMVSDVQLIPSEGLASRFVQMTRLMHLGHSTTPLCAFVVPVFEVEAHDVIPRTKGELMLMVKEERAVYFHRHVCSHCQKFPGIRTWLESEDQGSVKPFASVKREYPFHRWEPVYIGSKDDPFYSEALSWEGLQDKMTQMLEMCLMGYQFVILDGAFLVHWPGIKKDKYRFIVKDVWRSSFQQKNSMEYKRIVRELQEKYGDANAKCRLQ